ncbi:hypothetical protein [Mesorhizobium sp.]|uniref:hypothetical protein n=1 Tax=Mesorhizobium sp. TaxID=1871066 RepID=UPI00257D3772|nr:hypothetical protein [Mesorhizobium sp.]
MVALCLLAWLYIAAGAGLGMNAWEMSRLALFPHLQTPNMTSDMTSDMPGMDMSGMDMSGMDMSAMNMSGTDRGAMDIAGEPRVWGGANWAR